MANYFVNSACATPTSPYSTAATAALSLSSLLTDVALALDDIIWMKSDSVTIESSTASVTLSSEGATYEKPLIVFSTADWVDTPASIDVGAKLTTTGAYSLWIVGSWLFYGVIFEPTASGTAGSNSTTIVGQGVNGPHCQTFNLCKFIGKNNTNSNPLQIGTSSGSGNDSTFTRFNDSSVFFANVVARIQV